MPPAERYILGRLVPCQSPSGPAPSEPEASDADLVDRDIVDADDDPEAPESQATVRSVRGSRHRPAEGTAAHPRTIISMQWLRTPRIQRLLDEILAPDTRHPGFFDLLIVDEAHHCAPPAPTRTKGYAVDSHHAACRPAAGPGA